jgi:hypothetical protein
LRARIEVHGFADASTECYVNFEWQKQVLRLVENRRCRWVGFGNTFKCVDFDVADSELLNELLVDCRAGSQNMS